MTLVITVIDEVKVLAQGYHVCWGWDTFEDNETNNMNIVIYASPEGLKIEPNIGINLLGNTWERHHLLADFFNY